MLRNIVYLFGPIIRSTLSANLPIGVDLEAEKRYASCYDISFIIHRNVIQSMTMLEIFQNGVVQQVLH